MWKWVCLRGNQLSWSWPANPSTTTRWWWKPMAFTRCELLGIRASLSQFFWVIATFQSVQIALGNIHHPQTWPKSAMCVIQRNCPTFRVLGGRTTYKGLTWDNLVAIHCSLSFSCCFCSHHSHLSLSLSRQRPTYSRMWDRDIAEIDICVCTELYPFTISKGLGLFKFASSK